ncbi:uncharacterized protein LOC128551306 [Mercenaria mercenaria]|uniref:uncharacterized protein LOC128551306 n=1 Tax=Mercenaria mercenaria TaxID=6596 RepID=UPI00234E9971|nr:uncharacterized protein LOC128551306 [Mercenaria mercenaria]
MAVPSSNVKDFLTTVEEHLERGHVYFSADDFVKNLSLCPRLAGREKAELLLNTLLKMVKLAKEKKDATRNKRRLTQWLKEAAHSMLTFQVANRDWISNNVWKLPDLPKPVEQVYDPTKGKRDIRYFPTSKSDKALEKEVGDESVDEDVLDLELNEDELLASPRVQSNTETAADPTQPMEVDQQADSPSATAIVSPRKSPRLAEKSRISPVKAPPQEVAKPKSPKASKRSTDKEDQKRASSSSSRHPKEHRPKDKEDQKRASSSSSGHLRENRHEPRRHSEDTSRTSSMAEDRKKHSDRSKSRQDDRASSSSHHHQERDAYSVAKSRPHSSTSSGASSSGKNWNEKAPRSSDRTGFRDVERHVTFGRGMTVDYQQATVGLKKRSATAVPLESLVISTTVLKKQKTDDILHQVKKNGRGKKKILG